MFILFTQKKKKIKKILKVDYLHGSQGVLHQLYFSPKSENRILIILPTYQPAIAG